MIRDPRLLLPGEFEETAWRRSIIRFCTYLINQCIEAAEAFVSDSILLSDAVEMLILEVISANSTYGYRLTQPSVNQRVTLEMLFRRSLAGGPVAESQDW